MGELWIALGLCAALGALATTASVEPTSLLVAGFWITLAGLAFGVPTGVVYHVALRRALLACGRLPERWWLRPTRLHGDLPESDRARVLAWCGAGAAGFLVSLIGCAIVALSAWRELQR